MAKDKYIRIGPHAFTVPFDNENDPDCNFTAETVQEAIEELCAKAAIAASPGYAWGRAGTVSAGAWLLNNEVVSNIAGIPFALTSGVLTNLWVGCENLNTFDVQLYEHDGDSIGLTLLTTVSLVAQRKAEFDVVDFGVINVSQNKQLAIQISSGSAKNVKVFALFKGNTI